MQNGQVGVEYTVTWWVDIISFHYAPGRALLICIVAKLKRAANERFQMSDKLVIAQAVTNLLALAPRFGNTMPGQQLQMVGNAGHAHTQRFGDI